MKDAELRGIVLQKFYEMRNTPPNVQMSDLALSIDSNRYMLANICEQLQDHSLIKWHSIRNDQSTEVGGYGSITAQGVDVIEGTVRASLSIVLRHSDQSMTVQDSPNVQIDNSNMQVVGNRIDIDRIFTAIENARASKQQKDEAKSLWTKLSNNATFAAIIGAIATMIATSG